MRVGWALLALTCLALCAGATADAAKPHAQPPLPLPPGGATARVTSTPVRSGHIGGIVPSQRNRSATSFAGSGNLTYHGGPVMHTNTTYAIFWLPAGYTVSSDYQSVIDGYFQNVAADNGATTNVYSISTEYSDGNGPVVYDSAFGGAIVDTNTFPANNCSDAGLPVCLTDAQIQAEVDKVITDSGLTAGLTNEFFVFTPETVGSCFTSASAQCAYTYYCAYHGSFTSSHGNGTIVYANQPYTADSATPGGCDIGERPNNSDADPTINVLSHEHNESITDPELNAWYDGAGYENGDKCAWDFGTALGATGGDNTDYNQQIGTGKYWLQQEWSNKTGGGSCVQRYEATLQLAGTGTGKITSGDGKVSCTGNPCDLSSEVGHNVTLTATPDSGSTFANWSGDCTGGGTCTLAVTASTSLAVRFDASGLPSGWSEQEIAPPDGVDPYPAGSSSDASFFGLASSGDGTERAKTIYHPPSGLCYYDSSDTGGIYLEHKSGSDWVADGTIHAPSLGSDELQNWLNCGNFGSITRLSDDGTTLLVSQDMSSFTQPSVQYRCAVLVYKRAGDSSWTLDGTLYPPGVDASGTPTWDGCDYFGIGASLSADGTRVAVLSFGHVEVFARGDGGWAEEKQIDVPNGGSECLSSISPAMLAFAGDASRILVSDPNCDTDATDAGLVYSYDRSGSDWTLAQTIHPPDPVFQGEFGTTVALADDGSTAVVSAGNSTGRPSYGGAAWVYEHDGTGWHLKVKLVPTTADSQSLFTCSTVLLGGARILCGAVDTVSYDARQGSVYAFTRNGSSWAAAGTRVRLYAQQGLANDWLGHSGEYGWRAFSVSSDGSVLAAPIAPHSIPLYGHSLLGYEFTAPELGAPAITSFAPNAGAAGSRVRIAGSGFTGALGVTFNGIDAARFTVDSDSRITAVVPAGATSGTIAVTTVDGTVESTGTFASLAIVSFTPASGGAGTRVTVTGTNFTTVSSVRFGGKPATFRLVSPTRLTAVVPAGAPTGKISATGALGFAPSVQTFTVVAPPRISFFVAGAGSTVRIVGLHLANASAVKFHGVDAAGFVVVDDTRITATVPANATAGTITVTTPGGTATSAQIFKPRH